MKKLATLLIIAIALTVISCQQPANVVTPEQLEAVKTELNALKTDVTALKAVVDSLVVNYNAHLEKYHKGTKPAGGTKPTQPRVGG